MTYLPGIGLGEYLKHRKIWQSYNGPVTVQVLGIAGIDQVHSAQAHLILDNEVVQGSIPFLIRFTVVWGLLRSLGLTI